MTCLCLLLPFAPVVAQTSDVILFPKTLVDRAIEARSASDIAKDNEIVLRVNALMAQHGTLKASTRIYEQRLLISGLFDDKATFDAFKADVRAVPGIKTLYWHAIYMPKAEQERRELLDWTDVVVLETKAQGRLIGKSGVADTNFRVVADPFGTLYLLGRARSEEEHAKARQQASDGDRVKKLVDYVEVRP